MRALVLVLAAACGSPQSAQPAATSCPAPTAEIAGLVARIDADADQLHLDYTPAVHELSARDVAGACAVLELLAAPADETRLHAARVLEGVLLRRAGFVPGQGFADPAGEERARADLVAIGYVHDAPLAEREAAAARWRAWVERAAAAR